MADIDLDKLATVLGEKIRGGNSTMKSDSSGLDLSTLKGQFTELVGTIGPVITGFSNVGKGADALSSSLHQAGNAVGDSLGKGFNTFVDTLDDGRNKLRNQSETLGQDFYGLNSKIAGAGTTFEDHSKLMQEANGSLNAMGRNSEAVNNSFLTLQGKVQENPIAVGLKATNNMNEAQLNKAAVIYATTNKLSLRTQEDYDKAAASVADFAREVDENAKLTGKSRDQILDETAARNQSIESQLSMNLLSEAQQKGYAQTQGALAGMGKSINDAALNVASGTRLSEESRLTLQSMGPAGAEFQRAVKMQTNATDEASKKEAAIAMEKAKADIAAYQSTKQYAQMAISGNSDLSTQMKKVAGETQAFTKHAEGAKADISAEKGEKVSTADALAIAKKEAQAAQEGKATDIKTGKETERPELKMLESYNTVAEKARISAAGATDAISKYNTKLGEQPELLNKATAALEKVFGTANSQAEASKNITGVVDKGTEAAKSLLPSNSTVMQPTGKQSLPGLEDHVPGTPIGRDTGSLGKTGKFMEDFGSGTLAMLHGKEGVITEDQFNELTKALDPKAMTDIIKQYAPEPKPAVLPELKLPEMPGVNAKESKLEPMFKMPDISKSFDTIAEDFKSSLPKEMPDLSKTFDTALSGLSDILPSEFPDLSKTFDTALSGLSDILPTEFPDIGDSFDSVIDDFSDILPTEFPDLNKTFDTALSGLSDIMPTEFPDISDSFDSVMDGFSDIIPTEFPDLNKTFSTVSDNLTSLLPTEFPDLNKTFDTTLSGLSDILPTEFPDIGGTFSTALSGLSDILPTEFPDLNKTFDTALSGLSDILPTEFPDISESFDSVMDGFSDILPTEFPDISESFDSVMDGFSDIMPTEFPNIGESFDSVMGDFKSILPDEMPDIGESFDSVIDSFSDIMPTEFPDLGATFDSAVSGISDLFPTEMPDLGDTFDSALPDFESMFPKDFSIGPTFDNLTSGFDKMTAGIPNVKDLIPSFETTPQPPEPPVKKAEPAPVTPVQPTDQITLKDVHAALLDLNKTMSKMVSHTESISDSTKKGANYAAKSTGNRVMA